MAHPDHDQVIGRLVGARLRGAADGRAVSGAPEAHPDAETWAAYVDGGLRADEVLRLETHLAGCPACRRLLAVLMPEVSSGAASAVREVEEPATGRGVVIPFPRRQVFAWMAAAAGLLMAVTLWSVSRLGDWPAASVAMSTPRTGAGVALEAPTARSPADSAAKATAPQSRLEDRKAVAKVAGRPPAVAEGSAAREEQDKRKADSPNDALALRSDLAVAQERQAAQAAAAPAANAPNIPPQANTATAGARPRGPIGEPAAGQPAAVRQQPAAQAPPLAKSPPPLPAAPAAVASATPAPAPAPPAEPVAPPAQAMPRRPARASGARTNSRPRRWPRR